MIINIKGIKTDKPPTGFNVIAKDQNSITLQYGPIEGTSAVIIFPIATEAETWTFIGNVFFKGYIVDINVPISVSYRLLQEELPQTMGRFDFYPNRVIELNNAKYSEVRGPNEKFLY